MSPSAGPSSSTASSMADGGFSWSCMVGWHLEWESEEESRKNVTESSRTTLAIIILYYKSTIVILKTGSVLKSEFNYLKKFFPTCNAD